MIQESNMQKCFKNDLIKFSFRITTILAISTSGLANAANATSFSPLEQIDKLSNESENIEISMLENDSLGDQMNLANGAVIFSRTDGKIPGNFNLEVAYRISYLTNFPNWYGWKEDLPRIELTYGKGYGSQNFEGSSLPEGWKNGQYCSGSQLPTGGRPRHPKRFNSATKIVIPGRLDSQLLKNNGSFGITITDAPFVAKEGWKISCFTSDITGEEGFKATNPDGDTYYFEYPGSHSGYIVNQKNQGRQTYPYANHLNFIESEVATDYGSAVGHVATLFVSKVEDRFGNWVKFDYEGDNNVNNMRHLSKISSSDNRVIDIEITAKGKRITSASKVWDYYYEDTGSEYIRTNDFFVKQPDDKVWKYSLHNIDLLDSGELDGTPSCNRDFGRYHKGGEMKVIHPSGLVGIYKFNVIRVDKANLFSESRFEDNPRPSWRRCKYSYALSEKKLINNSETYIWKFEHSETLGSFENERGTEKSESKLTGHVPSNIDRVLNKKLIITSPDLTTKSYYINRDSQSALEGSITAIEVNSPNSETPVIEVMNTYDTSTSKGDIAGYNYGSQKHSNIKIITTPIRLTRQVTSTPASENNTTYTQSFSDFNLYELPETQIEEGPSGIKYTKNEYFHDTKRWALNLPTKTSVSKNGVSYKVVKENLYKFDEKTENFNLYKINDYGVTRKVIDSYHSDGNIKKILYPGINRYEQYDSYFRGIAREITLPCGTINGCDTANRSNQNTSIARIEVSPDGKVKSITDFKGNKTSYNYDSMGRPTKIDYADPKWADKIISYATVTTDRDGISGSNISLGSLRQTISQGNYEKRIYHDALLRPVFFRERDITDPSTIRYQVATYDHENRQTLFSFLSNDANNRKGIKTEYDALGRVTSQTRTSDNSISRRKYKSGNKVSTTDGEGNTTTTTYLAYGTPTLELPTLIEAPDSDDIALSYNMFNQVTSIRQGGVTETRVYDNYQQLCKRVRPDTGISAIGYNAQRLPVWYADGTIGSKTSCDTGAVPSAHKTLLSYDNLGQVRTINFPDSTPDKAYSYDANGNLTSLSAGTVNWNYSYNSKNALEDETLILDGQSYMLDWEYNSLGAINSLKYPSGSVIDFSPNGLGQATKAGVYVNDVSYYPNGKIKKFTYGNGIVRNMEIDTTGRINHIKDSKGSSIKNNLIPSYDYNDNLTRLIDSVDRSNDIDNLTYDGVNRLKSANGKWGSGSYTYDGIGNLISRSINNSTINYRYNSLNRLNNLTGAYAYRYQYDSRGNITNNGRFTLTYNLGQQMTSAKGISYLYDGNSRLVRKTKVDGNYYTTYSLGGKLLFRQKPNGTMTDNIYLNNLIVAEVDHFIKFNGFNKEPICKNVPIPGSRKTKLVCSSAKKVIRWDAIGSKSCSGTIKRYINSTNLAGTTAISGTKGEVNFGSEYRLKASLTCTRNSGDIVTESYTF